MISERVPLGKFPQGIGRAKKLPHQKSDLWV